MREETEKSIASVLAFVAGVVTFCICAVAFIIFAGALVWEFSGISFLWR